jgi:hypothetical protein
VAFHVRSADLPAWVTVPELTAIGVQLVTSVGAPSIGKRELTVTRASDGSAVTAETDTNGSLLGDPSTLSPFNAWKHDALVDTYTVSFADDDDLAPIVDVQLSMSYRFTYRADPGV